MNLFKKKKKTNDRAGEMALAALLYDSISIPNTHTVLTTVSPVPTDLTHASVCNEHTWCTNTHAGKYSHRHKTKINNFLKEKESQKK